MSVLPPAVEAAASVAEHLRASFKKAVERKTRDVKLPDYDELHVIFRALDDYAELRDGIRDVVDRPGLADAEREIEISLRTLVMSSVDSYAVIEGEKHEIGLPLGAALYDYINPPAEGEQRALTDEQATLLLFRGTMALMTVSGELSTWFGNVGQATDTELVKNS